MSQLNTGVISITSPSATPPLSSCLLNWSITSNVHSRQSNESHGSQSTQSLKASHLGTSKLIETTSEDLPQPIQDTSAPYTSIEILL